jgi:hypothetical protein
MVRIKEAEITGKSAIHAHLSTGKTTVRGLFKSECRTYTLKDIAK